MRLPLLYIMLLLITPYMYLLDQHMVANFWHNQLVSDINSFDQKFNRATHLNDRLDSRANDNLKDDLQLHAMYASLKIVTIEMVSLVSYNIF